MLSRSYLVIIATQEQEAGCRELKSRWCRNRYKRRTFSGTVSLKRNKFACKDGPAAIRNSQNRLHIPSTRSIHGEDGGPGGCDGGRFRAGTRNVDATWTSVQRTLRVNRESRRGLLYHQRSHCGHRSGSCRPQGSGCAERRKRAETPRLGIAPWWEECQGSSQFPSTPVGPLYSRCTSIGCSKSVPVWWPA